MQLKSANWLSKSAINGIIILICITCIIPIIAIVSISFSTESDFYLQGGYSLFPKTPTLTAYRFIFKESSQISQAYFISILTTSLGVIVSVVLSIGFAYPLSLKEYRYHKILTMLIVIPLVFNGGMVPTYMVMTRLLHLKNTIWAHIMPFAIFPFFIILLRTFFMQIPNELRESAFLEGASEIRILTKIIIPLSKPAIATITLFTLLRIWNDSWYTGMLYVDEAGLTTMPMLLQQMLNNMIYLRKAADQMGFEIKNMPAESARMAMCLLSILPVLFSFAFFQKYFVRGLTVGGVKG